MAKLKYKLSLVLAAVFLTALPLTGCNLTTPDGDENVVLKVGSTKPFKTTNKFADYWYGVLSNLTTHDSLIKLDSEMNVVPWLASDWNISEDSKTFTFTISDNAVWHDGEPLTADDVKFSIEYYRDRDPQAGWMGEIIESVTVSDNQVILLLARSYGNLLTEFMTYSIIPEHIWEGVDEPLKYEGEDRIIGSGPFKLVSWDQASGKFIFEANSDYFQGSPNIDRLEVSVFSNMDALVMALTRGDIDTWWDYSGEFPVTHISTLEKAGEINFASATFLGVPSAIGFNLDRDLTGELAFRQAVSSAINYEQIVELVYAGYGSVPGYGFVPSTHVNYDDTISQLAYDPEKAAGLLDGLGLIDSNGNSIREDGEGSDIKLTLLARSDMPGMIRVTEMVAADLKAVGIDTTIKAVDSSTWVATKDAMEYDLVFFRATPWGTLMHAGHGSGYFDSRRTGAGVLHNFDNPDYLELCDQRLNTALLEEQAMLDRAIQQMHANYLPGIALAWLESLYPYNENWDNWVIDHIYGGVVNNFSWFEVEKVK